MTGPFERDLMILMHDVARLVRIRFDQAARAFGMTRAQWMILARLANQPGLSQNEMAAICEVEPITIGRLVDRLEARGMLERRADPADRRIRRLHLLPAAEPILKEIAKIREVIRADMVEGIDPTLHEAFVDMLLGMKNKLTTEDSTPKFATAGE